MRPRGRGWNRSDTGSFILRCFSSTIYNADFQRLQLDAMMMALAAALATMIALTCALWPLLGRTGLVRRSEFSSIFQTAVRWNSFMALAIAQKIFPPAGMAVVALVMAIIIIPINLITVFLVTRFADRTANWRRIGRDMAINPMILGSLAAILFRFLPFQLYGPLNQTLGLVGNAALGMGLLAIGAGLRFGDLWRPRPALILPVVLKLMLFPLLLVGAASAFGVSGNQLGYLALCAAGADRDERLSARRASSAATRSFMPPSPRCRQSPRSSPYRRCWRCTGSDRRIERVDDHARVVARVEHAVGARATGRRAASR